MTCAMRLGKIAQHFAQHPVKACDFAYHFAHRSITKATNTRCKQWRPLSTTIPCLHKNFSSLLKCQIPYLRPSTPIPRPDIQLKTPHPIKPVPFPGEFLDRPSEIIHIPNMRPGTTSMALRFAFCLAANFLVKQPFAHCLDLSLLA